MVERGKQRETKSETMTSPTEVTSLDVGREEFEKFLFFLSITDSPCPLLVISLSLQLVVERWEQVEMVDWGGGSWSQDEFAVTQFFVHLPPQPGHVLLAKAEWLP